MSHLTKVQIDNLQVWELKSELKWACTQIDKLKEALKLVLVKKKSFTTDQIRDWIIGGIVMHGGSNKESERFQEHNRQLKFLADYINDPEDGIEAVVERQARYDKEPKVKRVPFCHKCIYGIKQHNLFDVSFTIVGCTKLTASQFKKVDKYCPILKEM